MIDKHAALLVIDMQNDFMETGSLPVKGGTEIIDGINKLMDRNWGVVVASQDWHSKDQISFASQHSGKIPFLDKIKLPDGKMQDLWTDHCIQNTYGAAIHENLDQVKINKIVKKGQNPKVDSYSAFRDNDQKEKTDLDNILKENGIIDIYIVGLARDYCTLFTALDGKEFGYNVYFVWDLTRAVNSDETDNNTRKTLKDAGINIISSSNI